MNPAAIIARFATGTYTVTRRTSGGYDQGRALPTTDASFSVVAAVAPASGNDLQRLPEGRRTIDSKIVFTPTELLTGAQGGTYEADWIAIDGGSWECQHVEKWTPPTSDGTAPGYRCIVQLRAKP